MKSNMFGETIIDNVNDDLGASVDTEDAYALINEADVGDETKFYFEILDNEDGEERAHSDSIFDTADAAKKYLRGWFAFADIQSNT